MAPPLSGIRRASHMADTDPQAIRAINWREVFPFMHIFRAFRVAVHPSKLVLGLLMLLTLYVGGRVLDAVWPSGHLPNHGELAAYETFVGGEDRGDFADRVRATRERNQRTYADSLLGLKL